MTGSQQVLVFAGAIDENRLTVQVEAVVVGQNVAWFRRTLAEHGPRDAADAKWGAHLVGGFSIALDHRREVIEIGIL